MSRIVLATDFSTSADRAREWAVYLATALKAELDVLHVMEIYPGMDVEYPVNAAYLDYTRKEAATQLAQVVTHIGSRVTVAGAEVLMGMPSAHIIAYAEKQQAELVVMGTQGRTGLAHVFLGSTAERVVKGAPCPVCTVRDPGSSGGPSASVPVSVRRILLSLDWSACSQAAVDYATDLACTLKAAVTVLHVLEPVTYGLDFTLGHSEEREQSRQRAIERAQQVVHALGIRGVSADQDIRGGLPADSIVDAVRTRDCQMIVMGTHGRRGWSHLAYGSVAEAVLRRAQCPVLTVRCQKPGPGLEAEVVSPLVRPLPA
jgi:nucleotide-binding universal stress UspA family protein